MHTIRLPGGKHSVSTINDGTALSLSIDIKVWLAAGTTNFRGFARVTMDLRYRSSAKKLHFTSPRFIMTNIGVTAPKHVREKNSLALR